MAGPCQGAVVPPVGVTLEDGVGVVGAPVPLVGRGVAAPGAAVAGALGMAGVLLVLCWRARSSSLPDGGAILRHLICASTR